MRQDKTCKNIIVVLGHSVDDIEVPVEMWIQKGPGNRRFVAPIAAKCADDGKRLPLSVIPLKYRNNWVSRTLIQIGILDDPWKSDE